MKNLSRYASLLATMILVAGTARAEETISVDKIIKENSMEAPQSMEGRHFWVELGALSDWTRAGAGAQFDVGYQFRYFAFDSRFTFGRTKYGAINVSPGYNQTPGDAASALEPDSELSRVRGDSDPWSYRMIEPGLSVSGKLFPRMLPLLTERGRFGVGYGSFHDDANDVLFTALIFSAQVFLAYQLGAESRWSLTGGMGFDTGVLVAKTPSYGNLQMRRLPVSWVATTIGLQYFF
jgi:hypothetical protein